MNLFILYEFADLQLVGGADRAKLFASVQEVVNRPKEGRISGGLARLGRFGCHTVKHWEEAEYGLR